MKFFKFLFVFIAMTVAMPVYAQYSSWYKGDLNAPPKRLPHMTVDWASNVEVGKGIKFMGKRFYADGVFHHAEGELTYPDGTKVHGVFNPYYGVDEGREVLFITPDRSYAHRKVIRNGQLQDLQTIAIKGRPFSIQGTSIVFVDPNTCDGGYNGNVSGNGSSSSGSSTNTPNHYTCRGCNGTKKCNHCNGTGYVYPNGHQTPCGVCHKTGRCMTCGGKGYVR